MIVLYRGVWLITAKETNAVEAYNRSSLAVSTNSWMQSESAEVSKT